MFSSSGYNDGTPLRRARTERYPFGRPYASARALETEVDDLLEEVRRLGLDDYITPPSPQSRSAQWESFHRPTHDTYMRPPSPDQRSPGLGSSRFTGDQDRRPYAFRPESPPSTPGYRFEDFREHGFHANRTWERSPRPSTGNEFRSTNTGSQSHRHERPGRDYGRDQRGSTRPHADPYERTSRTYSRTEQRPRSPPRDSSQQPVDQPREWSTYWEPFNRRGREQRSGGEPGEAYTDFYQRPEEPFRSSRNDTYVDSDFRFRQRSPPRQGSPSPRKRSPPRRADPRQYRSSARTSSATEEFERTSYAGTERARSPSPERFRRRKDGYGQRFGSSRDGSRTRYGDGEAPRPSNNASRSSSKVPFTEVKAHFDAYNKAWNTLSRVDSNIPFPHKIAGVDISKPHYFSTSTAGFRPDDIKSANIQSFFALAHSLTFDPSASEESQKVGGPKENLQSLIKYLRRKEQPRWHPDKLNVRTGEDGGLDQSIGIRPEVVVMRTAVQELLSLAELAAGVDGKWVPQEK